MRKLCFILLCAMQATIALAHPLNDTAMLKQKVLAAFATQPQGYFAVAFKNLANGESFGINDHEVFHAASTMKTPVLMEAYRQAASHKFSLTDSILVHTDFASIYDGSRYVLDTSTDSEQSLYLLAGTKVPIRDLLYKMITKSSNLATNLIIELVGAKNVMALLKKMGVDEIQVLRGVEDDKAFKNGMNNTVTAAGLAHVFELLAKGKAVNKKSSEAMIDILTHQYFRDVIPAKLPMGTKVANKSGSITAICHDSGIVFLPNGHKYVVVLLSRGIQDEAVAADVLSNVSRIIYDYVTAP